MMGFSHVFSLASLSYCSLKMTFMKMLIILVVDCNIKMLLIGFYIQKIQSSWLWEAILIFVLPWE